MLLCRADALSKSSISSNVAHCLPLIPNIVSPTRRPAICDGPHEFTATTTSLSSRSAGPRTLETCAPRLNGSSTICLGIFKQSVFIRISFLTLDRGQIVACSGWGSGRWLGSSAGGGGAPRGAPPPHREFLLRVCFQCSDSSGPGGGVCGGSWGGEWERSVARGDARLGRERAAYRCREGHSQPGGPWVRTRSGRSMISLRLCPQGYRMQRGVKLLLGSDTA